MDIDRKMPSMKHKHNETTDACVSAQAKPFISAFYFSRCIYWFLSIFIKCFYSLWFLSIFSFILINSSEQLYRLAIIIIIIIILVQ